MNLGIKSNVYKNMIVQLKMDEMSGTRLYNHAYDTKHSFRYVDVDHI